MKMVYGIHPSPLGACLVGMQGNDMCAVSFLASASDRSARQELARAWPGAAFVRDDKKTASAARALFGKGRRSFGILLRGTGFQMKVWEALLAIPEGKTASYAEIARAIGSPKAARAVGTACGKNPVAYLVPCHRVLSSSGGIGGYRWGLAKKRALLAREAA